MGQIDKKKSEEKKPALWVCIAIIVFFAACFILQVALWGSPNVHITLIFASVFAVVLLLTQGITMNQVEEGVIHGTKIATIAMMILMFIGIMIPSWTGAGTIPVLIYYGLKIISPKIFLMACVFVCALSCLVTGTSWGTIATFGVAMMGIGHGLGVPPAWTAGAIVSGSLFGDTLSPVSDFANLSSGTCEVGLFRHIKGMFQVTVPCFILSLIMGFVMSLKFSNESYDASQVDVLINGIQANFKVDIVHALISLIPMAIILVMGFKKVSSMAAIVVSAIVAMFIAVIFQGYNIHDMMTFMYNGFVIDTGITDLDSLFNRGGLMSMMYTVSIGYLGLSFGGILEKCGVMDTLLENIKKIVGNIRSLVIIQTITGCAVALISSSDYVSILISGRMFAKSYNDLGVSRAVTSRTCITGGAVFGWLFPWTVGGVYVSGALGISTFEFAPFAIYIFAILILNIVLALFGIGIQKASEEEIEERKAHQAV